MGKHPYADSIETGATLQYKVLSRCGVEQMGSAQHQSQSQTSVTNQKVIASITSQCLSSITLSQTFPHCDQSIVNQHPSTTSSQHTIPY